MNDSIMLSHNVPLFLDQLLIAHSRVESKTCQADAPRSSHPRSLPGLSSPAGS